MISIAEPRVVAELIESIGKSDLSATDASANFGSLLSEAIRSRIDLPLLEVCGASLEEIELVSTTRVDLRLKSGRIGALSLGYMGASCLALEAVQVGQLEILGSAGQLNWVSLDGEVSIDQIVIRESNGRVSVFETENSTIRSLLGKHGVKIAGLGQNDREELKGYGQSFAETILQDMDRKGEGRYVVKERSLMPGGSASPSVWRPNDDAWSSLTKALIASDLASMKPLNASGVSKCWITLKLDPALIFARSEQDARIAVFWSELERIHRV